MTTFVSERMLVLLVHSCTYTVIQISLHTRVCRCTCIAELSPVFLDFAEREREREKRGTRERDFIRSQKSETEQRDFVRSQCP